MASASAASSEAPPPSKRTKWESEDAAGDIQPSDSSLSETEWASPAAVSKSASATAPSSSSSSSLKNPAYLALSLEASGGLDSGFSDGTADGDGAASPAGGAEDDNDDDESADKRRLFPNVGVDDDDEKLDSLNIPHSQLHDGLTDEDEDGGEEASSSSPRPPPPGGPSAKNDDDDGASDVSALSGLSGEEWKAGGGVSGPFSWIQRQMSTGADPRELLRGMISADSEIPDDLDQLTLWKIILNILSEPPRRKKLDSVNTVADVVDLIRKSKNVVVLTGAGVSVSCGIPDFRSRDGVYARLAVDFPDLPDPQAMFDINYFRKDPRPFFKFAREIYPGQFAPSPCHRFIRALEKNGKLLRNYTQNIDTLEQVVGIGAVVQCHGSFATATCTKCKHTVDADFIKEDIFRQRIPFCPVCPPAPADLADKIRRLNDTTRNSSTDHRNDEDGEARQDEDDHLASPVLSPKSGEELQSSSDSRLAEAAVADGVGEAKEAKPDDSDVDLSNSSALFTCEAAPGIMKPDIVFFGEGLGDAFHKTVAKDKEDVDLLVMIGSSLKVRPVALIPSSIPQSVPQVLINREPLPHLSPDVELLGDCDGVINQLCAMLGEGWEEPRHADPLVQDTELMFPSPSKEDCPKTVADAADPAAESAKNTEEEDEGSASAPAAVAPAVENSSAENSNSSSLAGLWQPKRKISWSARLKPGTFLYRAPSRYVFPGAEVYSDDDEDDSDDDGASSSSSSDDDEGEQQGQQQQEPSSSDPSTSPQEDQMMPAPSSSGPPPLSSEAAPAGGAPS